MYSDLGHKKMYIQSVAFVSRAKFWTHNTLMCDKVRVNPPKIIRAHKDPLLHTNALFFNGPGFLVICCPPHQLHLISPQWLP